MAIDPRMLEEALRMNDGQAPRQQTGGVMEMLTPKFNEVQFAEAGQLPPLNLNLDNIDFDPQKFLEESTNMPFDLKSGIENEIESILTNADAGDEEDGLRAISALGLDTNPNISPDEKAQGYKEISDLIQEGGIGAVEEFVRSIYAPDGNDEAIPEWALPASVFGTYLMNEPGDWKQAIIQARGKTAVTMLNKGVTDKATKDKLDLDIRKKALDLYTASKAGNKPTATSLVGLVGKVTPASLAKYETSGRLSDLVLITDQKSNNDLLKDFTAESVGTYEKSGEYADLIRVDAGKNGATKQIEFLKLFTPDSVKLYESGDRLDPGVLVRTPSSTNSSDIKELTALLEDHTAESVQAFKEGGYDFSLLRKKTNNGLIGAADAFGDDSDGQRMSNITQMIESGYIERVSQMSDKEKIDQLNTYAGLYKSTTETQMMKTGSLDTLKQRFPFVATTPTMFAESIGLDLQNPEIAAMAKTPIFLLPTAPAELSRSYLALGSLRNKMETVGKLLEFAPDNLVGVKGQLLNTDTARALADATGLFNIPSEVKLANVILSVAEIDLIEAIIKEDRFTEQDRTMVRQFIRGDNYKDQEEALLRYNEVMEIITREEAVINNQLEGNYQPVKRPGIEERTLSNKKRIDELLKLSTGT
jgi:hypothetical protein